MESGKKRSSPFLGGSIFFRSLSICIRTFCNSKYTVVGLTRDCCCNWTGFKPLSTRLVPILTELPGSRDRSGGDQVDSPVRWFGSRIPLYELEYSVSCLPLLNPLSGMWTPAPLSRDQVCPTWQTHTIDVAAGEQGQSSCILRDMANWWRRRNHRLLGSWAL